MLTRPGLIKLFCVMMSLLLLVTPLQNVQAQKVTESDPVEQTDSEPDTSGFSTGSDPESPIEDEGEEEVALEESGQQSDLPHRLFLPIIQGGADEPGDVSASGQLPALMIYRDAAAVSATLQNLANNSAHAQVVTIGHSVNYQTGPTIYPIKVIRISASSNEAIEDDYSKNSVVFECGMHAREWLATESCLMLAEHLVANAANDHTSVPELLANVDVWIIPLTDVAGRVIDDQYGGDPLRFDTSVSASGWRGNGDTRHCNFGVNIARNFSRGFTDPQNACGSDYPGVAPFSTLEATALRNFVQNHGIAMAVIVHTNASKVGNVWVNDISGESISDVAAMLWGAPDGNPNLKLARDGFGRGQGQFSAWLTSPSDMPGQPDRGSARGIQTIFVELPFTAAQYNGSVYRLGVKDSSNGFHPSSDRVRNPIRGSFIIMAEGLIHLAQSPGCPLDIGNCPPADFGLVGAKIERNGFSREQINTNSAGCFYAVVNGACQGPVVPARDYLIVGTYYLDYRVQNFSGTAGNDDAVVSVTVDETVYVTDGTITGRSTASQTFWNMTKRELRSGRFTINMGRPGADYTVTLRVQPTNGSTDGFGSNDTKVFKIRASQ